MPKCHADSDLHHLKRDWVELSVFEAVLDRHLRLACLVAKCNVFPMGLTEEEKEELVEVEKRGVNMPIVLFLPDNPFLAIAGIKVSIISISIRSCKMKVRNFEHMSALTKDGKKHRLKLFAEIKSGFGSIPITGGLFGGAPGQLLDQNGKEYASLSQLLLQAPRLPFDPYDDATLSHIPANIPDDNCTIFNNYGNVEQKIRNLSPTLAALNLECEEVKRGFL